MEGLEKKELLARMDRAFNRPRNVAVVGAARHNNFGWIRRHLPFHQKHGQLFHVNIDKNEWPGAEALGVQNFPSLLDIPEPIDYVSISVPRQIVPRVLQDCIGKGVAVTHVFTAGFGESAEDEGIRLEQIIRDMARQGGMPIIGPNCVGLFNPAMGLRQAEGQYHGEGGFLGYISNSGTQAIAPTAEAIANDIRMSKCFSMGNGFVLEHADYLDFLAQDEETEVIGMYIEGIRTPQRFFESLREACKRKPVIIWKVGQTEDAARAVMGHSGTGLFRDHLWNALVTKCGAIQVNSIEEMIDTVKAIHMVPPGLGYNVGIYAATGGHTTESANAFARAGFKTPPFSEGTLRELASFLPLIGGNYVNPIDSGAVGYDFGQIMGVVRGDSNIDVMVVELPAGRLTDSPELFDDRIKVIKEFQEHSVKPIIVIASISFPKRDSSEAEAVGRKLGQMGIASFSSFERGARALKNVVDYYALRAYLAD